MAAVGGDLAEISCTHPTLGQFIFVPKSNESSTFDRGGVRSNDDANMIDGGGQMIDQLNRVRWSVEATIAVDDAGQNTQVNLTDMAASPVLGDWTFTHINGDVFAGKGKPVGDLQPDKNVNTMTLKVAGGGRLSLI